MGAPIPDAPAPETQDAGAVDAGFAPGPPAASLCGFILPTLNFRYAFNLPGLGIQIPPPIPTIALGLSCDLNNPIDVSVNMPAGGGRKPSVPKDPDTDYD